MIDRIVERLMFNQRQTDNSFKEKSFWFPIKYTQAEVREIWFAGIKLGIETGLFNASLEGQIIELTNNIENERHREFYDEFIKLVNKYNCGIQYSHNLGMKIIDLIRNNDLV